MTPELEGALSVLLQGLIAAAIAIITYLVQRVALFVNEKRDQLKSQIGEAKFALLVEQVGLIVKAAEQMGISGAIGNTGAEKLNWATERVQELADRMGVRVDVNQIRTLIEAAIRDGLQIGSLGEG